MRILVDCDGVLADFQQAYLTALFETSGVIRGIGDVTDFDFTKCVATKEQDNAVWRHIDRTPGFVRKLDWHPGAEDGLTELFMLGHVVCVTSPHIGPTWMFERMHWLTERGFSSKDVVFAKDKSIVSGHVLIDDKPEHCDEWSFSSGNYSILLDAPYNRVPVGRLVHRAKDWTAVVDGVKSIMRRGMP
jgi:5'(3')-deoxyribonucleotidase